MRFSKGKFLSLFESMLPEEKPALKDTGHSCRYGLCSGTYLYNEKENTWVCSKSKAHWVGFHQDSIAFKINMGATYTGYKTFEDWITNKEIYTPVGQI